MYAFLKWLAGVFGAGQKPDTKPSEPQPPAPPPPKLVPAQSFRVQWGDDDAQYYRIDVPEHYDNEQVAGLGEVHGGGWRRGDAEAPNVIDNKVPWCASHKRASSRRPQLRELAPRYHRQSRGRLRPHPQCLECLQQMRRSSMELRPTRLPSILLRPPSRTADVLSAACVLSRAHAAIAYRSCRRYERRTRYVTRDDSETNAVPTVFQESVTFT